MEDQQGKYYYPFPQNRRVRMYVKKDKGMICFRLWSAEDEKLWEEHGWVPYEAIKQAASRYDGKSFDPGQAYDIEIAQALLKESGL